MIVSQPKPIRLVDEAFLEFIRDQPCITCGEAPRSQASHLTSRGAGGSDYTACSQCWRCHGEWHRLGLKRAPKHFIDIGGVDIFRAQAQQLASYFSSTLAVVRRATQLIRDAGELSPAVVDQLKRLFVELKKRAAE